MNNQQILENTLSNFGIICKVMEISYGPKLTQYNILLAPGIKVSKVLSLNNDLSLALKSPVMTFPVPNSSYIGIQVPNGDSTPIPFENNNSKNTLNISLGQNTIGEQFNFDLTKTPHLLIAGQTGSGKSVCLNTILISLIQNNDSNNLKLLLIDPKQVEFVPYNSIPHLLTPVITNSKKAITELNNIITEMENRYEILSETGCRNIESYNKINQNKLPYIVVMIDEFADLMTENKKEIEKIICRIAQKSRAVGIHLIISVQRPSVDVITGTIKSNIPTRITFKLPSKIDSHTIIDSSGAEQLLGNGDGYFKKDGELIRFHGSYINDEYVRDFVYNFQS